MSKTTLWINASLFIFSLLITGCQTHGTSSDVLVLSYGMQLGKVSTDTHQHLIISHKLPAGSQSLHVYIEGDGSPWIQGNRIALDPSPRRPLALQLMTKDTLADTLYLGRPCYFNKQRYGLTDNHCRPELWTSHRYSETVVTSMTQALQNAVDLQNYQEVVFIGYSGGGTLAMLIGHQLETQGDIALITLAANLDTQAWTQHHHYTPLFGSLNPAQVINTSNLPQRHLIGGNDKTVPPGLNQAFLNGLGYPQEVITDFDHACCWLEAWPALLEKSLDQVSRLKQTQKLPR